MKKCGKCGSNVNAQDKFCITCGSPVETDATVETNEVGAKEVKTKKTNKLPGWAIALIVLGCIFVVAIIALLILPFIFVSNTADKAVDLQKGIINEIQKEIDTTKDDTDQNTDEYTFDQPFTFGDLEITISSNYTWTKVDNQFSEHNGADVIEIPITIVNKGNETSGLNMVFYSLFGSTGTELEDLSFYFDNNVVLAGEIRPGATQNSYLHFLYDGDGKYYIEFDNYVDEVEVALPIKK